MNFGTLCSYRKSSPGTEGYQVGYTTTPDKMNYKSVLYVKDFGEAVFEYMKTSENDSFVFIITKDQANTFDNWIKKVKLEDHIIKETKFITNQNYNDMPPRYKLVILQHPKHPQRQLASN